MTLTAEASATAAIAAPGARGSDAPPPSVDDTAHTPVVPSLADALDPLVDRVAQSLITLVLQRVEGQLLTLARSSGTVLPIEPLLSEEAAAGPAPPRGVVRGEVRGTAAVDPGNPLADLLAKTGGGFRGEDVEQMLGVSRQALLRQRQDRRILALRLGPKRFVYPAIQFVPSSTTAGRWQVHPAVPVLMLEGGMFTPSELFGLLCTPQPLLENQDPWTLVLQPGQAGTEGVERVRLLLRHLRGGAPGDSGGEVRADLPFTDDPSWEQPEDGGDDALSSLEETAGPLPVPSLLEDWAALAAQVPTMPPALVEQVTNVLARASEQRGAAAQGAAASDAS